MFNREALNCPPPRQESFVDRVYRVCKILRCYDTKAVRGIIRLFSLSERDEVSKKLLKRRGKSPEEIRDAMSRAEDGEELYVIVGDFADDPRNPEDADHRLNRDGYITIVPHNINCTDYQECKRLEDIGLNINY